MLQRWTPNMWIFRLIEVTTAQWRATADADGTPIGDRAHSGHSWWPTGGHRWTLEATVDGSMLKADMFPNIRTLLGCLLNVNKVYTWRWTLQASINLDTLYEFHQLVDNPPKADTHSLVDQLWRTLSSQLRTLWSIGTLAPERDSGTPGGHWDTKKSLRAFQFRSGNLTKGWDLILLQIGASLCRRVHEKKSFFTYWSSLTFIWFFSFVVIK